MLTSFQAVPDGDLAAVHAALAERMQQLDPGHTPNWVFQSRVDGRTETKLMAGSVPEPHVVMEDGLKYRVHVLKGQNHGLFLDMAQGRRWVRAHAGARHVVNVDMNRGALAIGQQNHQLNGLTSGVGFLPHDIFTSWGKITRAGPYHLIIVDPPSYQKGSFVATKDYARLMRRLPDLLEGGGHVLLCLNAPELGVAFLQDQMGELAPSVTFVTRLENLAEFADASPERSLKVLVYRGPE